MSKKILVFIVMLLCAFTLLIVGCDKIEEGPSENENVISEETGEITDNSGETPQESEEKPQESGEEEMASEKIEINGIIEGKAVINPAFDWGAETGDTTYTLSLKDEAGAEVESIDLTAPYYVPNAILSYDRGYVLTVTAQESGTIYKTEFRTISGEGTPSLRNAALSVCEPFKSNMVIQRRKPILIRGTSAGNVLLTLDFCGKRYYAVSDASGAFAFDLPAMEAKATSSDLAIEIVNGKSLVLSDVLIGDVYLASGQSNMWWKLRDSDYDRTVDVENAINADLRFYSVPITGSATPRDTINRKEWTKISAGGTAYLDYSAIAFMTGSMLANSLAEKGVPVGIVCSAEGNTNIVNWMSKEYYDGTIGTKNLNYNAMIHPLQGAEFTGVIWYQGCNNSAKGADYKALLEGLMANWRELFRNETLPFYIVQLPVYDGDSGNNYDFSFVRESQAMACAEDANAYLIATCDGGDPTYIHPTEKRYIADRLKKSILATLYGEDTLPQGPVYRSHVVQGNRVIITTEYGEGLHAPEGESIVGFLLAGADGKYRDATAVIEEGKIVVTSDKVAEPVYIKYGFSKSPFLNLYNKDGFLMSPFRTDRYNHDIDLLDYTDLSPANYKVHPDGSAMTCRIVTAEGETGTEIVKANDGKSFGSIQLEKWGAIGYNELGVKIGVIGTNSGAKVLFRIVEGSYEIWAYEFTDEFTGKREFLASTSEFECVNNRVDGVLDLQAVRQVEVTVKADGAATVTILGIRFVDIPRSAPKPFTINEGSEEREDYVITFTPAAFADRYRVIVSADAAQFTSPIVDVVTTETRVAFKSALRTSGTPYYVKVIASNELGETAAKNSGLILRDNERYVINRFDYTGDAELQSYIASNMVIHEGLHASLDERGVKILSDGKGWQHFIFVLQNGFNRGYDTLKFYLDVRDYHGSRIVIQIEDQNYQNFSYTLNTNSKREGFFEIPLSAFAASDSAKFDGRDVFRIKFNFDDSTGSGIIYFDDLELLKS